LINRLGFPKDQLIKFWFCGHNLPATNGRQRMKWSKLRMFAPRLFWKKEHKIESWGCGPGPNDVG